MCAEQNRFKENAGACEHGTMRVDFMGQEIAFFSCLPLARQRYQRLGVALHTGLLYAKIHLKNVIYTVWGATRYNNAISALLRKLSTPCTCSLGFKAVSCSNTTM